MKAQEAWEELKLHLVASEKMHKDICTRLGWHEQTGRNIFTDVLEVMDGLEKKYE